MKIWIDLTTNALLGWKKDHIRTDMKKLKRLQYGDFLIKGKNLKEVMIENKYYRRYINHLGRLSKNALPF
jgi:hypothetical protein|nr:MAG TPA: hypothetical protein [Caudoviricetes sp.]